jgi:hypothetical protein
MRLIPQDFEQLSDCPRMKKALRLINEDHLRYFGRDHHVKHCKYLPDAGTAFRQAYGKVIAFRSRLDRPDQNLDIVSFPWLNCDVLHRGKNSTQVANEALETNRVPALKIGQNLGKVCSIRLQYSIGTERRQPHTIPFGVEDEDSVGLEKVGKSNLETI